jgi:HPt (histidine-containing phosphotransfer) domain-containing protein
VPGLDLGGALQRMAGRHDLLCRVLDRFVSMYADGVEALRVPAQPDPCPSWREVSHTLRGACAIAGCSSLVERLLAFEAAVGEGRDRVELSAEALAIDGELRAMAAELRAALGG